MPNPRRWRIQACGVALLLGTSALFPTGSEDTRIYSIQGRGHSSSLAGQVVRAEGVVTGLVRNGFYFQDLAGDGDPATSDGLFAYTRSAPSVILGDRVRVSGRVSEYRPGGRNSRQLTVTQLVVEQVESLGRSPEPVRPVLLGRSMQRAILHGSGIDFWESLEGMRVRVENGRVVQGTRAQSAELVLVTDGGGNARGGVTIRPDDFHPERIVLGSLDRKLFLPPSADVGDRLEWAEGVVGYSRGKYVVLGDSAGSLKSSGLEPEITTLAAGDSGLSVASFNVENLGLLHDSDGNLQPDATNPRIAAVARIILDNLGAPDICALQEMGDENGAPEDGRKVINDGVFWGAATFAELVRELNLRGGRARYAFTQVDPQGFHTDGGWPEMNIRVGYLYREDRGVALAAEVGSGPRLNPNPMLVDPQASCYQGGRKPLAAHFTFRGHDLFLVNLHLRSKRGDDPLFGATQPPVEHSQSRRRAQAENVHTFVAALLQDEPETNVIVLGDFNDFPFSPTIEETLCGDLLLNLHQKLPPEERYTYIYQGNSQALDHILVSRNLFPGAEFDVVHVNAELDTQDPRRVSDHDPIVARLEL